MADKLNEKRRPSDITPEGISVEHVDSAYPSDFRFAVRGIRNGMKTDAVLTYGKDTGEWQSAHSHRTITELYFVCEEWIAIVFLSGDLPDPRIIRKGQCFLVAPEHGPHVVYLSANAAIVTAKCDGIDGEKDWDPAPELDMLVRELSEDDLIDLAEPDTGGVMK